MSETRKNITSICFFIFTLDGSVAKGVCSRESQFPHSGRHIVSIMLHTIVGETEPFKKHCGNKHKEIERERKEGKMLYKLRLSHLFGSIKNSDGGCLYTLLVFVNGIFLKGKPLEFDFREGNTHHLPKSC